MLKVYTEIGSNFKHFFLTQSDSQAIILTYVKFRHTQVRVLPANWPMK